MLRFFKVAITFLIVGFAIGYYSKKINVIETKTEYLKGETVTDTIIQKQFYERKQLPIEVERVEVIKDDEIQDVVVTTFRDSTSDYKSEIFTFSKVKVDSIHIDMMIKNKEVTITRIDTIKITNIIEGSTSFTEKIGLVGLGVLLAFLLK